MATIQAYYFIKNGSSNFDCKATLADSIGCEAVVTFSGSEIGKPYLFQWLIDDVPYTRRLNIYSRVQTATGTTVFTNASPLNLATKTYNLMHGYIYLQ